MFIEAGHPQHEKENNETSGSASHKNQLFCQVLLKTCISKPNPEMSSLKGIFSAELHVNDRPHQARFTPYTLRNEEAGGAVVWSECCRGG